jgi:ATP adenylyltransferase
MDYLWAPWRLAYVAAAKPPAPGDPCFVCRGLAENEDRANLIAWRLPRTVVILNRFPYNNGHLLVAPRKHKGDLADLESEEVLEIHRTVSHVVGLMNDLMHPDGYNIGLNLGRAAGAGLPGHLHWHVVPRWNGDTNFMTVLSDVRVISQSLDALWELLVEKDNNAASKVT